MKIIIPSFQRSEQLKNKTLRYLSSHNVPNESIYIFTRVDDNNLSSYVKLRDEGYNVVVLVDVKGIGMTHNAITKHFDEGEFIIEIDDDMTDLIDTEKNSVNFLETCSEMKKKMTEVKASYGGTYQCDNVMFMKQCNNYTFDLRYMLGCLRFRFIRKDILLETNYAEDFENCILHYKRDNVIVKNNWIAPKTKNYNQGGCDGDGRNLETEKTDKEYLAEKYSEYCKLFERKSGRWDLRLKVKGGCPGVVGSMEC